MNRILHQQKTLVELLRWEILKIKDTKVDETFSMTMEKAKVMKNLHQYFPSQPKSKNLRKVESILNPTADLKTTQTFLTI